MSIPTALHNLPRLDRPSSINAAEMWLRPNSFIDRCSKLGDRFVVPMAGSSTWLCLTNPDDVKAVFTADTNVLRLGEALRKLSPHEVVLGPLNLTALDGDAHLQSRRRLLPAFTGDELQSYEAVITEKAREMVEAWPVDQLEKAQEHTLAVTLEIIIAAVFGVTKFSRAERLRAAVHNLLNEADSWHFLVQIAIASSGKRGYDRPFRRIRRLTNAIDDIVREEIDERRAATELADDNVLARLLAVRDENGDPISDDELFDTMRLLLIGGHDTTGNTIAWALERLTRSPAALAAATQAAIDGDDAYLDAVLYETLRMRPVFAQTARFVAETFQLGDLTVPAGTMIVVMIDLVHMREDLYPDPAAFKPERYEGKRPGTYTWIPFGGGKRRCIGASMALLESRVILRELLSKTQLQATDDRAERIKRSTVLMVPANGAKVAVARRPSDMGGCPVAHRSTAH